MGNISIIKWGRRYTETYTYGSEIILGKSSVYFSSPMMPVGAKIKTWQSKGNFSESRVSPLLPLLISGKKYDLALFLEENEQNSLQLTIEFFDEFDNEITTKYYHDLKVTFIYPKEAVSYKVNLVNKKHESIQFYFMVISEASDLEEIVVNEELAIIDLNHGNVADELELVIDCLSKETTILSDLDEKKDYIYVLFSHQEKNAINHIGQLIKYIEKTAKHIRISGGDSFIKLPRLYQLFPHILAALYSDSDKEIYIDDTISQMITDESEIEKNVLEIKQALSLDGVKGT